MRAHATAEARIGPAELRLRLRAAWQDVRDSLWFLPALTTAAAIVAAQVLGDVELVDPGTEAFLFGGGSEAARTVLGTIAGSMITVTGLTFSLTVVALQVASGQFTPRLLRTFLGDRGNQVVLSAFIATFVYCLVLLRTIQDPDESFAGVVPRLGVSVAVLLALLCVGLLVYFIHHLTDQLRVDSVMDEVASETLATIDRVHPVDARPTGGGLPRPPDDAVVVRARRSGYLQSLDLEALFEGAKDGTVAVNVRLRPTLGSYVVEGTTLAWAWPAATDDVDEGPSPIDRAALSEVVHGAVHLGRERTLDQDVAFGIRQLVDVAVKALSPGVNDPTTAVQAVERLTDVLAVLATRPLFGMVRNDDAVVVGVPSAGFAEHLDLALRQVRRYGVDEPAVVRAMAACLRDLAEVAGTTQLEAVTAQLVALESALAAADMLEHDRSSCVPALAEVEAVVAGRAGALPVLAD